MKKIYLYLVIIITLMFISSCSNSNSSHPTSVSENSVSENYSNNTFEAISFVEIGKSYTVHGEYILKEKPAQISDDTMNVVKTNKDNAYNVQKLEGKFAKIKSKDIEGWIPLWYLTDEESKIVNCKPFLMIVKDVTTLCLYPNEKSPDLNDNLNYGAVIQVVKKYKNWYNVNFVQYEAANWGDRWVKSDSLITYDTEIASEGYVKEGTKIYNDKFEITNEFYSDSNIRIDASIKDSKDDIYYYFNGIAGATGYIREDDFIPNPFK